MNIGTYLSKYPADLLSDRRGRVVLTSDDPMLFALLYFRDHLSFGDEEPTLSEFHEALADYARGWTVRNLASRDAFIAPRNAGKTTWLFLILPMWAAAHGHLKFVAAFSDSASQATQHLQTFKKELDNNELLRSDFPELCRPAMGREVKRYIAQSNEEIQQSNGFSFMAKGVDAKSLGMKIGSKRPDLILLDDIEAPESNYSVAEAQKRLSTILNGIFPLNIRARIAIIGTTTMAGSIIDQIRKVGEYRKESLRVTEQRGVSLAEDARHDDPESLDDLENSYLTGIDNSVEASDQHLFEFQDKYPEQGETKRADNGFYVNLDKGNLTNSEQDREALWPPVERTDDKGLLGPVGPGQRSSGLSDFLRAESANGAAEEDFLDAQTSGLKSGSPNVGISTSLDCAAPQKLSQGSSNTEFLEQQERQRFGLDAVPAAPEFDVAEDPAMSFYDSLDPAIRWVVDERINVHYFPAIIEEQGVERSLWPEFWSLEYLNSIRNTRSFHMNYQNKPISLNASYWTDEDVRIKSAERYRYTLVSVDPAVSTKTSNDYSGVSVLSYGFDGCVYVRHAEQVRMVSTALRDYVDDLVSLYAAGLVYVESNQGGQLWKSVFDGISCKFRSIHQTENKNVRAGRALDYYKKGKVFHTKHFDALEEQMFSFPKVAYDDLVDSVGTGLHYFLGQSLGVKARTRSYI